MKQAVKVCSDQKRESCPARDKKTREVRRKEQSKQTHTKKVDSSQHHTVAEPHERKRCQRIIKRNFF